MFPYLIVVRLTDGFRMYQSRTREEADDLLALWIANGAVRVTIRVANAGQVRTEYGKACDIVRALKSSGVLA